MKVRQCDGATDGTEQRRICATVQLDRRSGDLSIFGTVSPGGGSISATERRSDGRDRTEEDMCDGATERRTGQNRRGYVRRCDGATDGREQRRICATAQLDRRSGDLSIFGTVSPGGGSISTTERRSDGRDRTEEDMCDGATERRTGQNRRGYVRRCDGATDGREQRRICATAQLDRRSGDLSIFRIGSPGGGLYLRRCDGCWM